MGDSNRNSKKMSPEVTMGTSQSKACFTPLKCVLQYCSNWSGGGNPLIKPKMIRLCNSDWPQYQLEDKVKWPPKGSVDYSTVQLMLLSKWVGKMGRIYVCCNNYVFVELAGSLTSCNLVCTQEIFPLSVLSVPKGESEGELLDIEKRDPLL